MCNCGAWARVPKDNFPPSDHHPDCKDFKQEPFTRLEYDGSACVMEPKEAEAMLAESEEQYTVSTVMLTREQFERMDDFHGF